VTGHVVDRIGRRYLLIVANAVTALAVLSLLFVHSEHQIWIMYAFAAFYGTSVLFISPAFAGLLKDMLPDQELASVNATFVTIGQGLRIASPLAGAALYSEFGGGSLAILDSISFAIAIAMLMSVRVAESPVPPADSERLRHRLMVGLRYVRTTPVLAQITTAAVTAMLVLGFYESVTFAVIAAIGRSPSFFGVLMAVQGAGSIAGGIAAARFIRRVGEARTLGIALVVFAAASLVYTIRSLPTAVIALVIFGVAVPLYAVALGTATQRFTPPRLQGRVGSTTYMLTDLSQCASIAIGASLVDTIDYRILLLAVAVVASAAALPVLFRPAPTPTSTDT
jgi:MFS family permease